MKPKTFVIAVLVSFAVLIGIRAARAEDPTTTTLAWDPNDPGDKVAEYVVQYRPRGNATNAFAWSEVIVKAGPAPTVVLPVSPFGTEFRLLARNALGFSPWTETVFLPAAVRGLKLVLPLAP